MKYILQSILHFVFCLLLTVSARAQGCDSFTIRPTDLSGAVEYNPGSIIKLRFDVAQGGTAPYSFYEINAPSGATFESNDTFSLLTFRATTTGQYPYSIGARDAKGCADTLTAFIYVNCDFSASPIPQTITGKVGVHVEDSLRHNAFSPYSNYVIEHIDGMHPSELPAGLTLSDNGIVSGTPSQYGVYYPKIDYTGLGPCPGSTALTVKIENSEPVTPLIITPVCRDSASVWKWEVQNPNGFNVPLIWTTLYYIDQGAFLAKPGDNFFVVPNHFVGAQGDSTRFQWYDQFLNLVGVKLVPSEALCDPSSCGPLTGQAVLRGSVGQSFQQLIPANEVVKPPYTSFQISSGSVDKLPAGLALAADGTLSGTPSEYGVFNLLANYNSSGGCPGTVWLTLEIQPQKSVKSLVISSVCSENTQVRNWRIQNYNSFNVRVTWETVYYNTFSGSLVAAPGDTYFETPVVGGPNTIKITWYDQMLNQKSIVQASTNELCVAPACVAGSSVDFFHQGLQKDGTHIPAELSDKWNATGEPDGKAFSLGYEGFAIVQLTANLMDKPGMDLTVYEDSPDNTFYKNPEVAEVFVSTDQRVWVSVGTTRPPGCKGGHATQFDLAGKITWCRFVKVLDITDRNARIMDSTTCAATSSSAFGRASNGFDLDAITCASGSTAAGARVATAPLGQPRSFLFPNPVKDWLTIDLSGDPGLLVAEGSEVSVVLYDLNGLPVFKNLHRLDKALTIRYEVTSLHAGTFIANIKTGNVSRIYKFVKE